MATIWNQTLIEQYIRDGVQESLRLEYKSAGSLSKNDAKKDTEITKDVSAFANSSGGCLVYGVKEFDERDKRHLPEKIDPVDQTQLSKEWLEQKINNVRPRINGVVIHPVSLNTGPNDVLYVVEIPQSTTAHQAVDLRYYRRHNFQNVPMEDYEIRDVMNRATTPDVNVVIQLFSGSDDLESTMELWHYYGLRIMLRNEGEIVASRVKLVLVLRNVGWIDDDDALHKDLYERKYIENDPHLTYNQHVPASGDMNMTVVYYSGDGLFPQEEIDVGAELKWAYPDEINLGEEMWRRHAKDNRWEIEWTLYADSMPKKQGFHIVADLPFEYWAG